MSVIEIERGEFLKSVKFANPVEDSGQDRMLYALAGPKAVFWLPKLAVVNLVAQEQVVGRVFAEPHGNDLALIGTPGNMSRRRVLTFEDEVEGELQNRNRYETAEYARDLTTQEAAQMLATAQEQNADEQIKAGADALLQFILNADLQN